MAALLTNASPPKVDLCYHAREIKNESENNLPPLVDSFCRFDLPSALIHDRPRAEHGSIEQ